MWSSFINSTAKGKEIIDDDVVKEVHNRLSALCSENMVIVLSINKIPFEKLKV